MRRYFYRFLASAAAACLSNFLFDWHLIAVNDRNMVVAASIDGAYPFLGLVGLVWLIDDRTWTNRLVITAGTSVGLVTGTLVVLKLFPS